jgi:hypothetical protein
MTITRLTTSPENSRIKDRKYNQLKKKFNKKEKKMMNDSETPKVENMSEEGKEQSTQQSYRLTFLSNVPFSFNPEKAVRIVNNIAMQLIKQEVITEQTKVTATHETDSKFTGNAVAKFFESLHFNQPQSFTFKNWYEAAGKYRSNMISIQKFYEPNGLVITDPLTCAAFTKAICHEYGAEFPDDMVMQGFKVCAYALLIPSFDSTPRPPLVLDIFY